MEAEMEVAEALIQLGQGPTVVKEGWLMKRAEYFKNWRWRYFILKSDGQFLGFKAGPADPSHAASMCNNFTVRGCQTMVSDVPRPGAFAVRGLHMDTVVERMFHTEAEEERREWLQAIETVRDQLGGPREAREAPYTSDRKVTMEDFQLMTVLGRGAFGKVVLCREQDSGTMYAMKILKKAMVYDKNEVEHTLTENRVLQTIRHPFIVGLKYSFTTDDRLVEH
jgi:RAC serine/threonine-protein kinase